MCEQLETQSLIKSYHGHVGHVQQILTLPDYEPDDEVLAGRSIDNTDTASVASGRSGTPALLPIPLPRPDQGSGPDAEDLRCFTDAPL